MRDKLLHVKNTEPGQPLQLEDGEWDGLTFRKELIYADDFHKRNATSNQKFTIDEMKLAHWEHVGNQMIADGVKVPTPLKHTDSPEANRGQIIRYERDTNSKGVPALYGVVKFRDAEAAKLANSTDISIFVPETPFYNGKGKKYEYGIRHVALTDYPVIPGLEGFVPIAASFDEFDSEPLELGLVSGAGKILRDRSYQTAGAQIGGEMVGENAQTKNQHRAAAGLLGASAVFGGREVAHIGKRFGKTIAKQYKKGGIGRVARSLGTFNKITRIKAAPSTFSSVYTKAPVKSGRIVSGIGKVARAVGRRIPLVGLAGAAAGAAFGAGAVSSGIQGAAHHASQIKNAPNRKRKMALSLEFKQMVQSLTQDLNLDFGQPERLELGGEGSGPIKGVKRGPYNVDKAVGKFVSRVTGGAAEFGTGAIRRAATGRTARYIAKGEAVNYLARKYRGDDDSRRISAYGATGGAQATINRVIAADKAGQESAKYFGVLKKIEKLGGGAATSKAKLVADALAHARLKQGLAAGVAAGSTALTAWGLRSLLRKKKQVKQASTSKNIKRIAAGAAGAGLAAYAVKHGGIGFSNELELGGPPKDGGVGSGNYKRDGIDESIDRFRKSSFFRNAKPYARKAITIAKAVARNPLAQIAGIGETLNTASKRIRGDDDNNRAAAYGASAAGRIGVESFKAADRERRIYNAAKKAEDLNFVTGNHAPAAATVKDKLFNFVTGKNSKLIKPTNSKSKLLAGAGVTVAGLLGASLLLKKRKKQELSLATVDANGHLHEDKGKGTNSGRFVRKMDGQRSARSMRRDLNSLKPKKYKYEDIGNVP